jgi:hypothetical protein
MGHSRTCDWALENSLSQGKRTWADEEGLQTELQTNHAAQDGIRDYRATLPLAQPAMVLDGLAGAEVVKLEQLPDLDLTVHAMGDWDSA